MSPMNWPANEIADALGAQLLAAPHLLPDAQIAQVCTDSRHAGVNDLFVCIKGERFDAHEFAQQVLDAGVLGLVVERELDIDAPQWVVNDTRMALGALAGAWRKRFAGKVLGVVGSNGKTTTKEMLAQICKAELGDWSVCVTAGNLNNDIGVPLTLLGLRECHQMAVVEMGMNHPGEIEYLAKLVCPDVLVLTNAQREHQEFMKTVEAVALENGQAFKTLQAGGCAVFPAGTAFDELWCNLAQGKQIVRFGVGGDVFEVDSTGEVPGELRISTPSGLISFVPGFVGAHNLQNACAAAAASWAAGCSLAAASKGLGLFKPVWGRMQVCVRNDRLVLINDAYNANPDSVKAAIDLLAQQPGNTLLVLGDMGEVGDQSHACHQEVGLHARAAGLTHLLATGQASQATVTAFGEGAMHFEDMAALIQNVLLHTRNGFWSVLVKGSRFMKMERVVKAMQVVDENGQEALHAS